MAKKNYDDYSKGELIELLKARDRRDSTRFGLVWEANEIERDKALNQDFVALDLVPELSCPAPTLTLPRSTGRGDKISPSPGTPGEGRGEGPQAWKNLIIEGDNFDALRYLKMCFAGRVKCIYIDPPYNTGNKDFVYNDRYVDKEDLWRHSKWCEFMFQRLTLAKDLLRQDGVIFVSIDDNEIHTLAMMMHRIFGEANHVATLIWKRRTSPDSRNLNGVSADHEYVIAYRGGTTFRFLGKSKDLTKYSNPDDDPRGPWMSDNLTGLANAKERPNLHYEVVNPDTGVRYPPHPSRGWAYGRDRMEEAIKEGKILWPKSPTGRPRLKRFMTDMQSATTGYSTILDAPGNVEATKELSALLPAKAFTFPKPTGLISELLTQVTSDSEGRGTDAIILDFFAGSGTTAHAVHKLNKEDGGNRRVILVSSTEATADEPDKNLCRDVCATRVRRVIEGYGDTPGLGGDFAYLRTRRIAPGRMLEIDHPQVWNALQLTHGDSLCAYTDEPICHRDFADQRLIYVPRFRVAHRKRLRALLDGCTAATVYSWQPELMKDELVRFTHAHVEAVPESLARRFGMKL